MSAPSSNLGKAEEKMKNIMARREINDQYLSDPGTTYIEGSFSALNNWFDNESKFLREMLDVICPYTRDNAARSLLEDLKGEIEVVIKTRDEKVTGVLSNTAFTTPIEDVTRYISEVSRRIGDLIPLVLRLTEIRRKLENAWEAIRGGGPTVTP